MAQRPNHDQGGPNVAFDHGEMAHPIPSTTTALYVKAQTQPPIRVAAERAGAEATIAGVVVAILAGLQHTLESQQVGFSWEKSLIAGVLVALPIIVARLTEGFIDQRNAVVRQ